MQAPPPAQVTVSQPLVRDVVAWDEYTGHLQSPEAVNVVARVSGFIEQVSFKEGALVHKGDVLFTIDDRPFRADLETKQAATLKDQAQVTLARLQLNRFADLLQRKVVAQQDFDSNKANSQQAEAQMSADKAAEDVAKLNLEWTRVTAPIDGRISRILVNAGNLINGGAGQATVLTTLVSIDPIYCYVPIPEATFLQYQGFAAKNDGKGVRDARIPCFVRLENETSFTHEGFIDFIDNSLDPTTGTIQARGVISNPDGSLTPGLFASMRVAGSGPHQAILVPDAAVNTDQNEHFLLIIGQDNVANARPVKLGELFGGLRAISDGLHPGEQVVVNGLLQTRPGSKVVPHEVPLSPALIESMEAAISGGGAQPAKAASSPAVAPKP